MPSLSKLKISSKNKVDNSSSNVDVDDIDEVDDQGQNVLLEIIKQLRPGCDLARITLPTFILERKSMLERITNQLQEPEIVIKAKYEKDPIDRFLGVVKWYMSCWHIAPKLVKKPLNPILGEVFTCYWDLPNDEKAYYIAEQTSHHPPKSSYFYMIPGENIRVDGIVIPKSKFLGNSTEAQMDGLTKLQYLDLDETYTLTQPNMFARGILFGKMKFELGDTMVIKCEKYDLVLEIEFKVKGFISGAYNHIAGVIKQAGEPLFELSGKWNEIMYLKDLKTKKEVVFFDCLKDAKLQHPRVRPLEEQLPIESRKLWGEVLEALAKRDHELATNKKFDIENEQRIQLKKRLEDGVEFVPNFFKKITSPKTLEDEILEFQLYKDLNGSNNEEEFLKIFPVLPGQKINDEFKIPEFKPQSSTSA